MTSLNIAKQYLGLRPAGPIADLPQVDGLKRQTIRAGAARSLGQGSRALLRLGTIVVLARLLDPRDFGLVAMVTVVTGVFDIFGTGGLSAATIQRAEISDQQISTLFWVNIVIGILLALLCLAVAPLLDLFYEDFQHRPCSRGAGADLHLQRRRRPARGSAAAAASVYDVVLHRSRKRARVGYHQHRAGDGGLELLGARRRRARGAPRHHGRSLDCHGRISGAPSRESDVSSMLRFGGTITLNNLVVYVAYNLEKVLLGRYFGPDALGLYGRATS